MIIIRSGMFKFEIIVFKFELSVLTKMLFRKFFLSFCEHFPSKASSLYRIFAFTNKANSSVAQTVLLKEGTILSFLGFRKFCH